MEKPRIEGWIVARPMGKSVWCVWERWTDMYGREHSEVVVHLVVQFDSGMGLWRCQVGGLADRRSILDRLYGLRRCLYQEWMLWRA